ADLDAAAGVEGDDVGIDAVAGGRIDDGDPRAAVAQGGDAGSVGADVVALHAVTVGAAISDGDPAVVVAGDDVSCIGAPTADEVGPGPVDHGDPFLAVRNGGAAGGVGADVVALHDVAAGAAPGEQDALAQVARDHVAGAGRGAADEVVAGARGEPDAR